MSTELYVAMAGAVARLQELDLIANNLANSDTVGFRRDRAAFASLLERGIRDIDGAPVPGPGASVFAAAGSPSPDLRPGAVLTTGGPLDVALNGDGLFEVQTPAGLRYTRAGSFLVSPDGTLATPDGFAVQGDGGPIQIGSRAAEIRASGEVVGGQGETLGVLKVVRFPGKDALLKDGRNLMRAAEGASPETVDSPQLLERSVERSNVEPVRELAGMVLVQRSFEVVLRAVRANDEVRSRLIQEISS